MSKRFLIVLVIGLGVLAFSSGGPAQQGQPFKGFGGGKPEGPFGGGGGGGFGGGGFGGRGGGFMALTPARWEYRVLSAPQVRELGKKDLEAGLNKLGDEGWELVAIDPATKAIKVTSAEYYFKRPKGRSLPGEPKAEAPQPEAKAEAKAEAEFRVFRLKHLQAVDVAVILDKLLGEKGSKDLRLVAEPASNALLARGSSLQLKTVQVLIERLEDLTAQAGVGRKGKE
jgi:hypothetical protein